MPTVTISSKFQVVIPKAIRESLSLKVGQRLQLIQYGDRLEFIPLKTPEELRGFLKGIDIDFIRDADRL